MPSYLITGASRGIGLEFVKQLSQDKANTVFGLIRSLSTAKGLVALHEQSSNVHIVEADITDHVALQKAAATVAQTTGGSLDVLINNAAFVDSERSHLTLDGYEDQDLLSKDLRYNFDINVLGPIHTINAFLPLLKKSTSPLKKVITISSGVGDLDVTLVAKHAVHAPYCISKAAVNLVNAKYAAQYGDAGFVFLALSPGLVDTSTAAPTPIQLEAYKEMLASFRRVKPDFAGPLTPEESVRLQLKVIENLAEKDNGAFLSHNGNKEWL